MKKTYVKPMAANVEFAMNENIAASLASGHIGFIQHASPDGKPCGDLLAYTGIQSNIVGEIETTNDLMETVMGIRQNIGNDAFQAIIDEIIATGTWSCWKA